MMDRRTFTYFPFMAAFLLTGGCSVSSSPIHSSVPMTTQDIASKDLPAVVTVSASSSDGSLLATGSGFFVAPGIVVTNVHVIAGASQLSIKLSKGTVYPVASVKAYDNHRDLALLDCPDAANEPTLSLGDTSKVRIGDSVVAAGSPLGLEGSISTGIVSAERDQDDSHVFQVTAPISHGSSGGPLLNNRGEVIGINSYTNVSGQNLNFAYSSAYVHDLLTKSPNSPVWESQSAGKTGDTVTGSDPHKEAILSLLAQPQYSGDEFSHQALRDAHLQLLDMNTGYAYFSIPKAGQSAGQSPDGIETVAKRDAAYFAADTSLLRFASLNGNLWELDGSSIPKSDKVDCLFATLITNLRFPNGIVFRFPYRSATYTLDSSELQAYSDYTSVYGGYFNADVSNYVDAMGQEMLSNRGAFVTKAGEPSIQRLAHALTEKQAHPTRLQKIQDFVDFVTGEITTDYSEASQAGEILKNASNVLMTRRGSPSNKAVLLASLLEQTDENYLIVYGPRHVWIAVPQDGFPRQNGMTFTWNSKAWTLIDLEQPRFQIGVTKPNAPVPSQDILFVQTPKHLNEIIDRNAGQTLGFR